MEISGNLPNIDVEDLVPIAELQPESCNIDVLFRVVKILPEREIVSSRTGRKHQLTESIVADSTARIQFSLWDTIIGLQCDDIFLLQNAQVRVYDCSMRLLKTTKSRLNRCPDATFEINIHKDMSKPFAWKRKVNQGMERSPRSFSGEKAPEEKGYCSWKEF